MRRSHSLPLLALLLSAGALVGSENRASDDAVRLAAERLQGKFAIRNKGAAPEFRVRKAHVDEKGQTHVRFSQYYNGVRVWGSEAITHMDQQRSFREDTLQLQKEIRVNTQVTLGEGEALAKVHADLAPQKAYAYEPKVERVIYPVTRQTTHRFMTEAGKTPNALEVDRVADRYHLAYHVHTVLENDLDKVKHTDYIVDAHTGRILDRWSSLQKAEGPRPAKGKGLSQYNGTVTLDTTQAGPGKFQLRDMTRSTQPHRMTGEVGNIIYDMAHGVDAQQISTGQMYEDADNTWGDGSNYQHNDQSQSANGQTAAVDTAYAIQKTWDYFKEVHGRNGFDGEGTATLARVHYDRNMVNAFFAYDCDCMAFGDGNQDNRVQNPMDLVAHEFGHGVCWYTSRLNYRDESGGLNEANSDIIGTLVEHWARGTNGKGSIVPDKAPGADWVMFTETGVPARFMHKPSLDDFSAQVGQPPLTMGCYSPDAWSPDMRFIDVHYSSGPMNRAFYFLAQGATVKGDTSAPEYLPRGMKGIGNTNAARLWYTAMANYMTPTSLYRDARAAMLRAAEETERFENFQGCRISRKDAMEAIQNAFAGINVGLRSDQVQGDLEAPVADNLKVTGDTGSITFSLNARDNRKVALVEFYVNGGLVGTGTCSGKNSYTLTYDSARLANATHVMEAKVYDQVGNITYLPSKDQPVEFQVNNASCELLRNNGFEEGDLFWWHSRPILTLPEIAPEGRQMMDMGGFGKASNADNWTNLDYLEQWAYLPDDAVSATLSFWASAGTQEAPGAGAVDTLDVMLLDVQGQPLKVLGKVTNEDANKGWRQYRFEVDPTFMGQEVFVHLRTHENEGNWTYWAVDNVSLVADIKPVKKCLANGDFEKGRSFWFGDTSRIGSFKEQPAMGGEQCLWLGGKGASSKASLYQNVVVPAMGDKATLDFHLHIGTAEKTTVTPYDRLMVQVVEGSRTHTLATFSNLDAAKGFRDIKLDLSAFKGRQIRLMFSAQEVGEHQTSFVLDNISVNVQ